MNDFFLLFCKQFVLFLKTSCCCQNYAFCAILFEFPAVLFREVSLLSPWLPFQPNAALQHLELVARI